MTPERAQQIADATQGLNPNTDFTKAGQPNMTVLKTLVSDITTEERDEIWPVVKAEKPAAPVEAEPEVSAEIITGEQVIATLRSEGHQI